MLVAVIIYSQFFFAPQERFQLPVGPGQARSKGCHILHGVVVTTQLKKRKKGWQVIHNCAEWNTVYDTTSHFPYTVNSTDHFMDIFFIMAAFQKVQILSMSQ